MDTKTSTITYEFRTFLPRCETYAIRLDGSETTGIYGPLDYEEVLFKDLPNFPYEEEVARIDWVKCNCRDFIDCETEYDEMLRI